VGGPQPRLGGREGRGEKHLEEIDRKMAELSDMRRTLSDLMQACAGDDRPDCPILTGLAGTNGSGDPPLHLSRNTHIARSAIGAAKARCPGRAAPFSAARFVGRVEEQRVRRIEGQACAAAGPGAIWSCASTMIRAPSGAVR
jgi:hypothetical protein